MEKIKETVSFIFVRLFFLIVATAIYAFVNFHLIFIALSGGIIGLFVIPPAVNIGLSCLHNLIKHESGTAKSWTDLYPVLGMIVVIMLHFYENHTGILPSSTFISLYFIYIIFYLAFLGIKYAMLYSDGKNNVGEKDSDKPDPPTV